jgi:hypothetical protein
MAQGKISSFTYCPLAEFSCEVVMIFPWAADLPVSPFFVH